MAELALRCGQFICCVQCQRIWREGDTCRETLPCPEIVLEAEPVHTWWHFWRNRYEHLDG